MSALNDSVDNSFFIFRLTPTARHGALTHIFCWFFNTVVRLGMIYVTVYTVASAWKAA